MICALYRFLVAVNGKTVLIFLRSHSTLSLFQSVDVTSSTSTSVAPGSSSLKASSAETIKASTTAASEDYQPLTSEDFTVTSLSRNIEVFRRLNAPFDNTIDINQLTGLNAAAAELGGETPLNNGKQGILGLLIQEHL